MLLEHRVFKNSDQICELIFKPLSFRNFALLMVIEIALKAFRISNVHTEFMSNSRASLWCYLLGLELVIENILFTI